MACDHGWYACHVPQLNVPCSYHRSCFKCSYCGSALTISKFSQSEGTLFCEEHFAQLASRAGHYVRRETPGDDKHVHVHVRADVSAWRHAPST